MGGYYKGGALVLLDDYNLFSSTGVFMKSGGDFLETKYQKLITGEGKATYTLANTRQPANILVKFEE